MATEMAARRKRYPRTEMRHTDSPGTCKLDGCKRPVSFDTAKNRAYDFCCLEHAQQAIESGQHPQPNKRPSTRYGDPPSGKWVGTGRNHQNGFTYRILFFLTIEDGQVTGVAVPPNAFQGFSRISFAGKLDHDNTCKLDHDRQSGWTKCRFRKHGHEWRLQCQWNMANLSNWYGTHELSFSGDTRTTPGGMSIF